MKKNYSFTLIALLTSSLIQAQTEIYLPFENRELTIEKVMAGAVMLFVYLYQRLIHGIKKTANTYLCLTFSPHGQCFAGLFLLFGRYN